MDTSYKALLSEILTIIDYGNDKGTFIQNFDRLGHIEAMSNIYDRLPEQIQPKFIERTDDPEALMKLIDRDEYINEFTNVITRSLQNFIKHMEPVLNTTQKEKITHLIAHY